MIKQTKKKIKNKKCFCGEQDILGNCEIELAGIKHNIYSCYEMKQTKKKCICKDNNNGYKFPWLGISLMDLEKYEVVIKQAIDRQKAVDFKRKYHPLDEPCKIEINKSKKRKINPTKDIDENLKCSHCGNKVIECMGKCETTLFKGKEVKEKNESFWSKFKKIINIKP